MFFNYKTSITFTMSRDISTQDLIDLFHLKTAIEINLFWKGLIINHLYNRRLLIV